MNHSASETHLVVYGHQNCYLSRSLKRELEDQHIDFEWRDVNEGEPRFKDELKALARGNLSVPTVIFADGTVMVEPRPAQVFDKLRPGPAEPQEKVEPDHSELLARLKRSTSSRA